MKLRRITQAALLGAVIALPVTGSAQDKVIEVRDEVIESTEAVGEIIPAADGQQLGRAVRSVVVEERRGGRYGGESRGRRAGLAASYGGPISFLGSPNRRQMTNNDELQEAIIAFRDAKNDAEKADTKRALEMALGQQFMTDMKRRQDELKAIKQRVTKMEAMLQKREDSRDEIIGLRLQTLVNNAEGLGWSTGPSNPRGLPMTWPNANTGYNARHGQVTAGWPVPDNPQALRSNSAPAPLGEPLFAPKLRGAIPTSTIRPSNNVRPRPSVNIVPSSN